MNDYSYSYLSHLACSRCHRVYSTANLMERCGCGAPVFAQYDLKSMKATVARHAMSTRPPSIWRYHELLPLQDQHVMVTLGEQMTPLVELPSAGLDMDISCLMIKDEGTLPSGTFKARGAAVGISRAKEMGVTGVAIPTNGNAGGAWSLYAARAKMDIVVVMPRTAPTTLRKECLFAGARVVMIDGTIADAGQTVREMATRQHLYDVSTLNEPYRLEGKKTMGFEIAEQFLWSVPDVIVYPTGGGAGVIGIYKALRELQQLGWIEQRMPRFVAVQSEGCAPLVSAFTRRLRATESWPNPTTIAYGMRVPKPLGDFLILDILYETEGSAVEVSDDEIVRERRQIVRMEGMHVCPEGAAALAGARKLRKLGWIRRSETVLVVNTGTGLKYVDQIESPSME